MGYTQPRSWIAAAFSASAVALFALVLQGPTAIDVTRLLGQTTPGTTIIDNGQPGFSTSPGITWIPLAIGYNNNSTYVVAQRTQVAQVWAAWNFTNITPGPYRVRIALDARFAQAYGANYRYVLKSGTQELGSYALPTSTELWKTIVQQIEVPSNNLEVRLMVRQGTPSPVPYAIVIADAAEIMSLTPASFCGDGVVNPPLEQCDDGNQVNTDGCNTQCQIVSPPVSADLSITLSGPRLVNAGGTITYVVNVTNNGPSTSANATIALPLLQGMTLVPSQVWAAQGEEVVSQLDSIAPNQSMTREVSFTLGNVGTSVEMEAMVRSASDPIPTNNRSNIITTTVVQFRCGDGEVNQASEQCDDGNTTNGDGCDDRCMLEEEKFESAGWECYDGTQGEARNGCFTREVWERSADGFCEEHCNDEGTCGVSGFAVGSTCQRQPVCGNGTIEGAEQCDDGNTVGGDGCSANCREEAAPLPRCGDGAINQASEQCDDGNTVNGDGCSAQCTSEGNNLTGNLYVTMDTTPVRSHQLLGSTLGETALGLKLRAENEDVDVMELWFTGVGVNSGGTPDILRSVARFELYKQGETVAFATATLGQCESAPVPANTFCARMNERQLVVPEGEQVVVLVRPRMKSDTEGGRRNDFFAITISGRTVSTNQGAVRARGVQSSNELDTNNGDQEATGEVFIGTNSIEANRDIRGPSHQSVLSKITSITNANPDANGTAVPTGFSPIGQFKFVAAAHSNFLNGSNDARPSDTAWTIELRNAQLSGTDFKLYNKADATTKVPCTLHNRDGSPAAASVTTGTFYALCANLNNTALNTEIDQGSDLTLVLEANIQNPKVNGAELSALRVSLDQFNQMALNGTFGVAESHFNWIDQDTDASVYGWVDYPENNIYSTLYQS